MGQQGQECSTGPPLIMRLVACGPQQIRVPAHVPWIRGESPQVSDRREKR